MTELLDAVDALTKPVRASFFQGLEKVHRLDEPLLVQLRQAIIGNIGGGAGASKSARERTPIDVVAFSLLEEIDGRVRGWHIEYASRAPAELTNALRGWYTLYVRHPKEEADITRHMIILRAWERRILDIIDPPTKLEITSRCPVCGARWVTRGTGSDAESVGALTATVRGADEFEANCSGCGKRWSGVGAVRQLRILIDEKESQTAS